MCANSSINGRIFEEQIVLSWSSVFHIIVPQTFPITSDCCWVQESTFVEKKDKNPQNAFIWIHMLLHSIFVVISRFKIIIFTTGHTVFAPPLAVRWMHRYHCASEMDISSVDHPVWTGLVIFIGMLYHQHFCYYMFIISTQQFCEVYIFDRFR